jgi:hypothetical protein
MSDDYTPSTDDVRTQYIGTTPDRAHHPHEIERREQIDRWLAAHDATVRADHEKDVRERIAQDILADRTGAPWEAERHEDGVGHWLDSRDATKAARIAREGA